MRLNKYFWITMFLCIVPLVSGCLSAPSRARTENQSSGAETETGQTHISKTNSSTGSIENTYPNPEETESPPNLPSPLSAAETNEHTNVHPAPGDNDLGENMKEIEELEPAMQKIVETAINDLAGRMDVESAEIEFAGLEFIIWPDGSLGCPVPGMRYKQVQVDGYRLKLILNGEEYAYHGGGNRGPFLCERGTFPADLELSPPGNPDV
jgi:hypothetical protein